jgi:hypothetical protein
MSQVLLVEARRLKPLQSALNTVLQSDPIALYESPLGQKSNSTDSRDPTESESGMPGSGCLACLAICNLTYQGRQYCIYYFNSILAFSDINSTLRTSATVISVTAATLNAQNMSTRNRSRGWEVALSKDIWMRNFRVTDKCAWTTSAHQL